MVRVLYILGGCAMLAACGVFGLWLTERSRDDLRFEEIRGGSGVLQMFRLQDGGLADRAPEVPPLVAQAEAFARLLAPAQSPNNGPFPPPRPVALTSAAQGIRPLASSANFRLYGTSCCPNQPGRSMALISEVGAGEGGERWVKEGAQVGHFVIHEIRQDGITYRDGDQLREMAVESFAGPTSIVQDVRPGSRRVSAVIKEVGVSVPSPIEPNGTAVSGN
jgi:hypothetical protein